MKAGDIPAQVALGLQVVGPVAWDGTDQSPHGRYLRVQGTPAPPPAPRGRFSDHPRCAPIVKVLTDAERAEIAQRALEVGPELVGRAWGMSKATVQKVMVLEGVHQPRGWKSRGRREGIV